MFMQIEGQGKGDMDLPGQHLERLISDVECSGGKGGVPDPCRPNKLPATGIGLEGPCAKGRKKNLENECFRHTSRDRLLK
jgi:hypothetical protein